MLTVAVSEPTKPRGRPIKCPDERLSEVLSIRLSPRDADAAYRFAQRHGQPLDAVLRKLLLRLIQE